MDRWPGAYPETPTPSGQNQEPQYPVVQQAQRRDPHAGLSEQPAQPPAPSSHPLATEVKSHDVPPIAGHPHTSNPGVGLSDHEYHRLQARTLDDERNPSVDEAFGGGTYVRPEDVLRRNQEDLRRRQEQEEGQPKHIGGESAERSSSGSAGWPLSNVSVQHEENPSKVHEYPPDVGHRAVKEVQQPHSSSYNTPGQQQQHEENPRKVHEYPPDVGHRAVKEVQQPHSSAYATPGQQQQSTTENLARPSHAQQQQGATPGLSSNQGNKPTAGASSDLARGGQPGALPESYQQDARSQQPRESHSGAAEKGVIGGALAAVGLGAYAESGKHGDASQQQQQQRDTTHRTDEKPKEGLATRALDAVGLGAYAESGKHGDTSQQQQQQRDTTRRADEKPKEGLATRALDAAGLGAYAESGKHGDASQQQQQPRDTTRHDVSQSKPTESLATRALDSVGLGSYAHSDKQDTRSQQSHDAQPEKDSHSGATESWGQSALAAVGLAGREGSGKHEESSKVHASELPSSYQQQTREAPQQSRAVQQQPQTSTHTSHDSQSSRIPVASHEATPSQQPHSAASHDGQSSRIPVPSQPSTSSHQSHDDDHSRSRSEKGLAAGALAGAGAGVAAHEYSSKHDNAEQQSSTSHQPAHGLRHESRELSQQQSSRSSQSGVPSSRDQTSTGSGSSSTPPYWGTLPTAPTGGIYNTVTGHGSGRDDHGEEHRLPSRDRDTEQDRAPDANIPTPLHSFPSGGIYNSVTGHGSGSESAKHHDDHHDTGASRMPLLGAGQSRNVQENPTGHATSSLTGQNRDNEPTRHHDDQHTGATHIPILGAGQSRNVRDTTGYGSPFMPEQRNVQRSTESSGPLHGAATTSSRSHDTPAHPADRSTYGETGTQRAFPLTSTSDHDAHHEEKSHSRAQQGLAAGALAGAGAGLAAHEYSGRHEQQSRDLGAGHGQIPTYAEQRAAQPAPHHAQAPTYAEQRTTQTQPAPHHGEKLQKRTSPEHKDKEHHGLFGLGGKHDKEDKHTAPVSEQRTTHHTQPEDKHKEHHGILGGLASHGDKGEGRGPAADHRADPDTRAMGNDHRLAHAQPQASAISPPNAEARQREQQHHTTLGGLAERHDMAEGRDPTHDHAADFHHTGSTGAAVADAGTEHRLVQPKPQPAAISPPNAEVKNKEHHGLFHHGNDDGRDPRDIAPIPGTHPAENTNRATHASPSSSDTNKRSSIDHTRDGRDSPKKSHGGILGLFHKHKDEKPVAEDPKSSSSHRRSGSIERHNTLKKNPPPKVARELEKRRSAEDERMAVEQQGQHGHAALAGAGAGAGLVGGGIAAEGLAHRQRDTTGTEYGTAGRTGEYGTLQSGTPSGVATGATGPTGSTGAPHHTSSTHGTTSHAMPETHSREVSGSHGHGQSGAYNTLADGTPSGVATSRAAGSSAPYDNTTSSNQADHSHRGLEAGAAAGVGAAGLYAATRDRDAKDSREYENTPRQAGQSGYSSQTGQSGYGSQSGTTTSGDNWRSQLPPVVGGQSTSTYGGQSATTYPTTSQTTGAVHDRQTSNIPSSEHTSLPTSSHPTTTGTTTTSHTTQPAHQQAGSGEYNTLSSGTASGVSAGSTGSTAGAGAAGLAAGAGAGALASQRATQGESHGVKEGLTQRGVHAAGATGHGTGSGSGIGSGNGHGTGSGSGHGSDLPNPYNVLPSGTPSGVNIEYRRRSKEVERRG